MEHKPIYLDGVDVSKCRYFLKDTEGQDYNTDEFVKGCCEAKGCYIGCEFIGYSICRGDKDCYYKQLVRKTQECEQKDKETNELHLIIDRLLEASGYDKNISTAEDFEYVYADINYKLGLIDDLKQECEELKKINTRYRKALEEIEAATKINCEEICGRKFADCNDTSCLSAEVLDIINKAKEGE